MSRFIRLLKYTAATLATVVVVAAATVYVLSERRLTEKFDVAVRDVPVAHDSTTIARGKHLATAIGKCVDCHAVDLGGKVFIDDPALGRITASNLTAGRGGVITRYTDAHLARAIRHGVTHDGRGAVIMPSDDWIGMADEDVAAIIAYLRQLPPVDRELAPLVLRPLGRTLLALNQLPAIAASRVDHSQRAPLRMAPDTTLGYGKYLADVGGCTGCHGPGLSGGKIPGTPPDFKPASNLTPEGIGALSDDQLEAMLRTGKRPDGSVLDELMPARYTALMNATEMRAVIKYLRSVPAKPFGNR